MRTTLLLMLAIALANSSIAQNINPYEQFGYQAKNEYVVTKKPEGILVINKDTSANHKNLVISLKTNEIFLFNNSDSVQVFSIDPKDLARFISVDPLTKKYPELTPYQFASNTPIQAIDLDGLEAFIVHGTTQTKTGVYFTNEAKEQFKRLAGNTTIDETFRWKAPITNDMPMRKVAAQELVQHVFDTRAKMIAEKRITEDEPISLIGYSHGGNVAIQAADMLYDKYKIKVNIIAVSTPAYNSWFGVDKDNFLFGNAEDPQGNKGINSMIHVIHQNDRVWQAAKADMYYSDDDGKTKDYTIQNSKKGVELNGPVNSHTDLPTHPNLGKVLSVVPAMPAAPKPTGLDQAIKAKQ